MTKVMPPLLILLLSFILPNALQAGLVVTEVMADEPASYTSLEWIEIYNNSSNVVFLGVFPIQIMSDTISLSGAIGAYEYAIICRKLFANGGSPAFEEVWGDNSGVWGDSPLEQYKEPLVVSFPPLLNSGGVVAILDGASVISSLEWAWSVGDGISWERESFEVDRLLASVDNLGGTPGFVNSVTPLGHDLDLQSVTASRVDNATEVKISIKSRSLGFVLGGDLSIFQVDPSDPDDRSAVLRTINLPGFDSAEVVTITEQLLMGGTYTALGAFLEADDRLGNNIRYFTAPGSDFPPVILTEIQARPVPLLFAEWVEVYNRADTVVDLANWWLGDSVNSHLIADSTLNLEPGQFLVLTDDILDFRAYYPEPEIQAHELATWPQLNNAGDLVQLVDLFGLEADQFLFDLSFDSNYTWSRVTDETATDEWGRSLERDGTPGTENKVLLNPVGSSLALDVIPQVFSPNGDGFDDRALIYIALPKASGYTLKIYDRSGREVRTFLDGGIIVNPDDADGNRSIWFFDGYDNDGRKLPIGIYIIYFEATGLETIKGSVVIAR